MTTNDKDCRPEFEAWLASCGKSPLMWNTSDAMLAAWAAATRAALATQPAAGEPVAWAIPGQLEQAARSGRTHAVQPRQTDAWTQPLFATPPAAAHGDEAVRKDAEVAIKQGRYLASAAEGYMKAVSDAFDLEETNLHREVLGDSRTGLASAVYEFRRRADAAMRAQGDGEVQ